LADEGEYALLSAYMMDEVLLLFVFLCCVSGSASQLIVEIGESS